ncbi:tocopherol cyclase family protein [Caproiciproducens sp.]
MTDYRALHKTRSFFEGWYFKHQNADGAAAFIPGVSFSPQGEKRAFLQVITREGSFQLAYPYSAFRVCRKRFSVRVGRNIFTEKGVHIDLAGPDIRCTGDIRYGPLTPIASDIMGPFRFVPFMECNHGVISMKHSLTGSMILNGEKIDFGGGDGYIEKDWGTSFPSSYLWVQCNRFPDPSCSIMVSIAKIPFGLFHFQGCIAVVCFQGREYRFATYLGVRILRCTEQGFLLKQGKYLLEADILSRPAHKLFAPQSGEMSRIIRENMSSGVRFRLYEGNTLLFDLTGRDAGYEYVK